MSRPTIGVAVYRLRPGRVEGWPSGGYGVPATYVEAIWRAGGTPSPLLPGDPTPISDLLARLGGLLLVGGGDVDAGRYGQDRAPEVYGVDEVRDGFEFALIEEAERLSLPTLAVCRGMQVLNVAFGGSLHQHLPAAGPFEDHGRPTTDDSTLREVTVVPGTRVADAVGTTRLRSTCHHHQGVDRVGAGLVVAAHAMDGLVEAIEREGDRWMLGVQWHPEETAAQDPAQQRLFEALVARAAR